MILLLSNIPRTCHHHWTSDTYSYDSRRSSGYDFIFILFFLISGEFCRSYISPNYLLTIFCVSDISQLFQNITLLSNTCFLQQSITFS